jgi:hypothetical protein
VTPSSSTRTGRPAGVPDRAITPADIEGKFREILGEVGEIETEARDRLGMVVAAVAVGVVVLAFVLGNRRGKKRRTVVEIRRV